jgi:hypothetical protein
MSADRHAAYVLPVVQEVRKAGTRTLREIAKGTKRKRARDLTARALSWPSHSQVLGALADEVRVHVPRTYAMVMGHLQNNRKWLTLPPIHCGGAPELLTVGWYRVSSGFD